MPGAADAALHLVGDQQDAVAVAQLPQGRQIAGRWNDVAALALDRLDEDGRHILRIEMPGEELLLDDVDAPAVARRLVGCRTGSGSGRRTERDVHPASSGPKPACWRALLEVSVTAPVVRP